MGGAFEPDAGRVFLANLWRDLAGVPERGDTFYSPEELRRTEQSGPFEFYRRNRLVMGALRYGRMHDPTKPTYDSVGGSIAHLRAYLADGNPEHLADAANLCEIQFVADRRNGKRVVAVDDGPHVPRTADKLGW